MVLSRAGWPSCGSGLKAKTEKYLTGTVAAGEPWLDVGREESLFPVGCADKQYEVRGGRRRAFGARIVFEQAFGHANGSGRKIEVVSKCVDTRKHGGVTGPAMREEHGLESLLELHVLARNHFFVGESDSIPD